MLSGHNLFPSKLVMKWILQQLQRLFPQQKRSRTVRFMYPAFISMIALLGANAITSLQTSTVWLEPSKNTFQVGELVAVDVISYAHVPVNAVDISVLYDASTLSVSGVDIGESVLTVWTEEPIVSDSKVVLRGGTFKRGFQEEHKIATINFKAKTSGLHEVSIGPVTLLAGDGRATEIPAAFTAASDIQLYAQDGNTPSDDIKVQITNTTTSDLNGDGKVTLTDVSMFMSAWTNRNRIYDFNDDAKMSFRDFSILLASYLVD